MADSGLELGDPNGQRLVFRKTAAETNGELLEVESVLAPNSPRPPAHYHPTQEERFTVLSGTVTACVDGVERRYSTGDSFTIPPRAVHYMHNADSEPARIQWETRPALNTERFFETVFGLVQDRKLDAVHPNVLQMVAILRRHRDEVRLTNPPPAVQAVLFPVLRAIAALLGYPAVYDAKPR